MASKKAKLEDARDPDCKRCTLSSSTTGHVCVFGRGVLSATYFLIGEAPGAAEEKTGEPFRGQSGRLLDGILSEIGISKQCYITNAVRCRPPNNRTPTADEIWQCSQFLEREIAIIKPKIIVTLGATARNALGYSRHRMGDYVQKDVTERPIVFTYHPAFLLRSGRVAINAFKEHIQIAKELVNASL